MAKYWFTQTHEYIAEVDGEYRVGISSFAAGELGDITFVELPPAGASFVQGETMATVESVKAVSEVYAPVDLEVLRVNDALADAPETVNTDPQGAGWFAVVKPTALAQLEGLIPEAAYEAMDKETH